MNAAAGAVASGGAHAAGASSAGANSRAGSANDAGSAHGGAANMDGGTANTIGDAGTANDGTAAHTGIDAAGAAGETSDDDALIVPQGLSVIQRPGLNSVFDVIALTLRQGPNGAEVYAAVRNDGTAPACSPSFSVELHDANDEVIAAGITGLMVPNFYRLTDGSDTLAGCVAAGQVTMAAINDSSLAVDIGDVAQLVYGSSYWILGVTPVTGLSVSGVQAVTRSDGVAYTGTLINGLDISIGSPAVEVFPVTHVGRPLGVALASGSSNVAPGGSWEFETDAVNDAGTGFSAFPSGSP